MPDKTDVIHLVKILQKLLFPGYFGNVEGGFSNIGRHTRNLLADAYGVLRKQVCRALNLEAGEENCSEKYSAAGNIALEFLGKLPKIRQTVLMDVQASLSGDPAAKSEDEVIFAYPGLLAVYIYRLAHELHLSGIPLIPRTMTEYAHSRTGIDIHPGAKIGDYFFIDHGTGVVIGETTEIGQNVKIYQGVTLGALSTRGGQKLKNVKRHPTLEDEVTVYSGASILGGQTVIGKGCVIGGNVFLTQSVPPGTQVSLKNIELNFITK